MQSDAKTVEQYLESLPEDRREIVAAIRRVVLDHLPAGYEETMNWGMISYEVPLSIQPDTYNGQPLMYAALGSQKNHVALYLTGVYMDDERRAALERDFAARGKKLDAGKSCVRLRSLDDVPLDVIGACIAAEPIEDFVRRFEGMRSARKARAKKTASSKKKAATRRGGSAARKKKASGRRTK